jgi:hypothetical protein
MSTRSSVSGFVVDHRDVDEELVDADPVSFLSERTSSNPTGDTARRRQRRSAFASGGEQVRFVVPVPPVGLFCWRSLDGST